MAVRRAPATLCPISSPLSPSLTSLFWILFLLPFFFSHALLLRHTYVTLTLSTKPFSSLLFRFFFSLRVPLRSTDISISTFVALSNFHITALFRNYVPQRCFLPPYFPSLWFRSCKTIPSNISSTSRSFTFVGLLDKRVGKSGGLLSRRTPRNPRPCIYDTVRRRYPFWDLFLRLTTSAFSTFNPHPLLSHQSNL